MIKVTNPEHATNEVCAKRPERNAKAAIPEIPTATIEKGADQKSIQEALSHERDPALEAVPIVPAMTGKMNAKPITNKHVERFASIEQLTTQAQRPGPRTLQLQQ